MGFWGPIIGAAIGAIGSIVSARSQNDAVRRAADAQGAPWVGQQPYLLDLFREGQKLYKSDQPIVAPWTTAQQLGNAGTVGSALNVASNVNPYGLAAWQRLASPGMLDVANNPYVMGGAQGIADTVTQRLMQEILPRIDMNAVRAGQYGSSRQALAQGQAIGQTNRALSQSLSDYIAQAYGKGLQAQTQAVAMLPGIGQSMVAPWQAIYAAGQQEQQQQERQLREPWERLGLYKGIVGQQYGAPKQFIPPSSVNPVAAGFGGALQGMALGGALSGMFGGGGDKINNPSGFNTLGKLYR